MAHMKMHPLARTSQDLRRIAVRLDNYIFTARNEKEEDLMAAKHVLHVVKNLRHKIPEEHRDVDLRDER